MFADAALAARIDRAEGRIVASVAEAMGARRADLRTLILPISGGVSVYGGRNSAMNKVIGLGFEGPIDIEALEQIEREWHAREEAVRVELSILADASIPVTLSERGYHVHGYENVLARALGDERLRWRGRSGGSQSSGCGKRTSARGSIPRSRRSRISMAPAARPMIRRILRRSKR